jgi:GrpB-like predicted nucleotidyltransferase (UPF0157 family)/predicted enzyme related to lactoylglutathione lyase
MPRKVEVLPYNPAWPGLFHSEAQVLADVFGLELLALHHIGSTSVPGLAAKPIIDILAEVDQIEAIDALAPKLAALGYLAKGEAGIPGRRFFIKPSEEERLYHLHVFQTGSPDITRHLVLRDYLACHPERAQAYDALKRELAARFPEDIQAYIAGKDTLVKEIEQEALEWAHTARPLAASGAHYAHTNLIARDWRRLAKFYQDVFGCQPVLPERDLQGDWLEAATGLPGAHLQGIHLRLPGFGENGPTLEIFQYSPAGPKPAKSIHQAGLAHLAFAVDDVPDAAEKVLAAGGSPLGQLTIREIPGAGQIVFIYIRDPEGNILELQQWKSKL